MAEDKNISLSNMAKYDDEIKKYIGSHAGSVVEMTQAEYDALPEIDEKTVYMIKDNNADVLSAGSIIYEPGVTLKDKIDDIDERLRRLESSI